MALIEADRALRGALARSIDACGLRATVIASNPDSALRRLGTTSVDLVVVGLPLARGRVSGVVHRLRPAAPTAQVVLYGATGSGDEPTGQQLADGSVSKAHGADDVVSLLARLARRDYRAAHFSFAGRPEDVPLARSLLRSLCAEWGLATSGEALIVLSELVSNAVRHGAPEIDLRAAVADGSLRLEVADRGEGTPRVAPAAARDDHGRGLMIIDALADAWGVETYEGGKEVWVELPAS